MKQALVLFGSPHRENGTTLRLLTEFLHPFERAEHWQIHRLDAYALQAAPCTACGLCRKAEACMFDDLDELDSLLRASDLLVVASPIYHSSFPAPVKAILDRTQRYFEARFSLQIRPPIEKGRKAVLLLTQGSMEAFGAQVAEYQLNRAFTVMNTVLAGTVLWSGTDRKQAEEPQAGKEAMGKASALALEILSEI